jgi:hypothetical protein
MGQSADDSSKNHFGAGNSVIQNGCLGGVSPDTAAGLPFVSNWALTTIRRSRILATDVGKRKLGCVTSPRLVALA